MVLSIAATTSLAADVVGLTLVDPGGGSLPAWTPGSHLELQLPSSLIRHYSLCGDPADRTSYQIAVLRVGNSRGGSVELHDRDMLNAHLIARGPRNHFALDDAPSYLFLAGGIGITPLLAMAQELTLRGSRWSLVYGARSARSLVFRDRIEALASRSHATAIFVPQDTAGHPDLMASIGGSPNGTAVYCCGPEGMIRRVEEIAKIHPQVTLHVERFAGSAEAETGSVSDQPFELVLAERGVTLSVPADKTALEVVLGVVPGHPYSCLGGQCGSCEVPVVSGEVDHRDEVLSAEEREAGSAMMLCVSRANTDRLVIEL